MSVKTAHPFCDQLYLKKLLTSISFILLFFLQLNAQTFQWAAQIGGTDSDTGEDIAFDASGNVYMLGIFFSPVADFNPDTANTYTLTSAGAQDVYVVKLDSDKNFKWAVRVGGAAQDFGYAIAVSSSGYVYVCGKFTATADFDPGTDTFNLISAGGTDMFILKLDTASNFIWAKQIGSIGDDNVEKFTLDNSEHLLLCGEFSGTVDFDPGAGVQNLTSVYAQDAYVLKLDDDGNYIWAGRFGSNPGELAQAIATDASNSIYVTGEFYGTIDFDPGSGVYNLSASGFNANIFVLKWDSGGNFVWADNMGNSSGGDQGTAIATDPSGNPVVAGSYFGTVDFDPGTGIYNLTAMGSGDIFVLKLNSTDGSLLFAGSMGGTTLDQPYGIAVSDAGNIFVTGLYSTTADFDPGASELNLTASGPSDAFLVELDNAGNFMWAYGLGGTQDDFGRGLNTHGTSDVYVSGVFSYTADFDPGVSAYNLSSFSNSWDAFLLKLRFCTPSASSASYDLCPGDSVFLAGAYQHDPGVYYDYYTAADGCDSIVTTLVQYTFVLIPGSDVDACDGETFLLDAGVSGASYLWNTGATTQTILVTATGDYSVHVTKNGCTQSDTIQVAFHALPVVNLGSDTAVCLGQSVILYGGNSGAAHHWSTGANTQNIVVSNEGTYWVVVTNSFGCTATDTIGVTVHPLPVVSLGVDTVICTSSYITLDAGANFIAYQWQDGSANETFTLDGSAGVGDYTLSITVTDSNGCINSDTILVGVEVCAGIPSTCNSSLLVYPNPASDFVIIQSGEMIREITLFNLTGEVIVHRIYDTNLNFVLLPCLPLQDGVYWLQMVSDMSVQVIKLLIQH